MSCMTKFLHLPPPLRHLPLPRLLTTTTTNTTNTTTIQDRPQLPNPHDLLTHDPIHLLSQLWIRSCSYTLNHTHHAPLPNLTGFLLKFDLWVLAYQRSSAHFTSSFPPKSAIHLPTLRSLLLLRHHLLSRKPPFPLPLFLSPRKPIDPTSFQERLLQELLLLLLEPVFEPRFSPRSHAFRPARSPHTVIRTIRSNFAGYLWYVKINLIDITSGFTPELIMSFVEKGVSDKKILRLVRAALKQKSCAAAEVKEVDKLMKKRIKRKMLRMSRKKKILNENEPKPDPYWLRSFFGFAPEECGRVPDYGRCGILSPLLENVCFNELDCWLEESMRWYFRPSRMDSIWKESIEDGCHNPAWPEFVPSSGNEKTRRMDFIRFGSHLLVGIRGPREDAVELKKDLVEFCESKYGMRLENSRVEIEHITRGIEFLDHVICRRFIHPTLRYTGTGGKIVSEKGVGTLLSVTASLQQCIRNFRRLELVKGDRDPEPLPCNPMLYAGQAHTNSQMNKFLETMADWYKYADNRKKIVGFCAYVVRSSIAKLYAARYRLKSRAKVYKIASRDLRNPLRESTRNDAPEYSDLLRMGLVDAIEGVQFAHMSSIPSCDYTPFPRNWIPDHERVLREYVRLQDPKFFCELNKSVRRHELNSPQDEISKIVWDYKVCGVWSKKNPRVNMDQENVDKFDDISKTRMID